MNLKIKKGEGEKPRKKRNLVFIKSLQTKRKQKLAVSFMLPKIIIHNTVSIDG